MSLMNLPAFTPNRLAVALSSALLLVANEVSGTTTVYAIEPR